ncbi:MAG: hypothetical protein IPG10_16850 [Flavobacteriales bacterium]|nr:hypothetical protein [Flavobacteriales bacterium]
MTRVDLRSTDGVFERSVRTCLENAVLQHPSSARQLLKDGPEKGTADIGWARCSGPIWIANARPSGQ